MISSIWSPYFVLNVFLAIKLINTIEILLQRRPSFSFYRSDSININHQKLRCLYFFKFSENFNTFFPCYFNLLIFLTTAIHQPSIGTTCFAYTRLVVIFWILEDCLWFGQQKASSYPSKRSVSEWDWGFPSFMAVFGILMVGSLCKVKKEKEPLLSIHFQVI